MGNEFAIIIADRGWVFVGEFESYKDEISSGYLIKDAKNIRIWGTKNGLGEIALNGPTKETVLDNYGTVKIPLHSIIGIIESKADLWKK